MKAFASVAAIGLTLLAAGCKEEQRDQFAVPVHEAYTRLAASSIPDFMADRQCGILIHNRIETIPDRSVTWRITSSNRQMLSFTASLIPVDAQHTKVAIDVSKEANGREAYDGSQDYMRPAVQQPVRPAIQEQVSALIEGRPFDAGHITGTYTDQVCGVQRSGLENGTHFSIYDRPGMDADQSAAEDASEKRNRGYRSYSASEEHDSEFDRVARRYQQDNESRDINRWRTRDSRDFSRHRAQGYGR